MSICSSLSLIFLRLHLCFESILNIWQEKIYASRLTKIMCKYKCYLFFAFWQHCCAFILTGCIKRATQHIIYIIYLIQEQPFIPCFLVLSTEVLFSFLFCLCLIQFLNQKKKIWTINNISPCYYFYFYRLWASEYLTDWIAWNNERIFSDMSKGIVKFWCVCIHIYSITV